MHVLTTRLAYFHILTDELGSGCQNQQIVLKVSLRSWIVSPLYMYVMIAEISRIKGIYNVYMFFCCSKKREHENCDQQTQICRPETARGPIHSRRSVAFLAARAFSRLPVRARSKGIRSVSSQTESCFPCSTRRSLYSLTVHHV